MTDVTFISPRRSLQYDQVIELFPLSIRNRIFANSEYRNFKRDEPLFMRGDEGTFMAGVMSGRLRMTVSSPSNKEMLITMVEKGELVGEMSLLDDAPRAVDVFSETDSTLMIVQGADFLPVLRSCPDAMMGLLKLTCHRMRAYLQTMEMIALESLPIRLARYILKLAADYGKEENGQIFISAQLSQMDIANQLACTRESINKQLAFFVEKKLITLQDQGILLLNPEGLRQSIMTSTFNG